MDLYSGTIELDLISEFSTRRMCSDLPAREQLPALPAQRVKQELFSVILSILLTLKPHGLHSDAKTSGLYAHTPPSAARPPTDVCRGCWTRASHSSVITDYRVD